MVWWSNCIFLKPARVGADPATTTWYDWYYRIFGRRGRIKEDPAPPPSIHGMCEIHLLDDPSRDEGRSGCTDEGRSNDRSIYHPIALHSQYQFRSGHARVCNRIVSGHVAISGSLAPPEQAHSEEPVRASPPPPGAFWSHPTRRLHRQESHDKPPDPHVPEADLSCPCPGGPLLSPACFTLSPTLPTCHPGRPCSPGRR